METKAAYRAIDRYKAVFDTKTVETFNLASKASFKPCEVPTRKPDYVSPSKSKYWFSYDGVIRQSDHWLRSVGSCDWSYDGQYITKEQKRILTGFCSYEDMKVNKRFKGLSAIKRAYKHACEVLSLSICAA